MYYFYDGEYRLFYDKQLDCDGHQQALLDLANDLEASYAFIFETMLGGPEDLAFEYGGIAVRYVGKSLNTTEKIAKGKNIAKGIYEYIKASKLAKAAGNKVDDLKTWWSKLKDKSISKLFNDIDFVSLTAITPSGAKKSYINSTTIADNAKKLIPFKNSSLSKKVDDYISATTSASRGKIGEDIAEELVNDMDGFISYPSKLNASDNGMDVIAIKGSLQNPTSIRIIESKPMNSGAISLGETVSKGTQMSTQWIDLTVNQMRISQDENLKKLGEALYNTLNNNSSIVERYVCSIDKVTKEIVLIKLNPF